MQIYSKDPLLNEGFETSSRELNLELSIVKCHPCWLLSGIYHCKFGRLERKYP